MIDIRKLNRLGKLKDNKNNLPEAFLRQEIINTLVDAGVSLNPAKDLVATVERDHNISDEDFYDNLYSFTNFMADAMWIYKTEYAEEE